LHDAVDLKQKEKFKKKESYPTFKSIEDVVDNAGMMGGATQSMMPVDWSNEVVDDGGALEWMM